MSSEGFLQFDNGSSVKECEMHLRVACCDVNFWLSHGPRLYDLRNSLGATFCSSRPKTLKVYGSINLFRITGLVSWTSQSAWPMHTL
jgi:hypothetical protein